MTRSNQRLVLFCFLALLSMHGIVHLPTTGFDFKGLDFQNMHAFSVNCLEWPVPYEKSGFACGDVLNRSMLYPPLLFYMLSSWPRLYSFHQASYIWEALILIFVTFGSLLLWSLERRKSLLELIGFGLLYAQLPMFYALERGNNDAITTILWSIGVYLFIRKKNFFWAGVIMGVAAADKIYPAFGVIGIVLALAFAREWRAAYLLTLGSAGAFLALFVLFLPSSWTYFFIVAPAYGRDHSIATFFGHSLFRGPSSLLIKLPLLVILAWGASKRMRNDPLPMMAFFGTFGTFLPNTANDYSLITAMPFALILIHRALRPQTTRGEWAFFLVLMFAFFGDRTPFAWIHFTKGHQLLFIACFLGLAWTMARSHYFWKDDEELPAWLPEDERSHSAFS